MLTLLLRKMLNTKWMVACLLIGFIMASAMLSTIPIYMNASLQRMLVKDMEAFQIENNIYPGTYSTEASIPLKYTVKEAVAKVDEYTKLTSESFEELGVNALSSKLYLVDGYEYITSLTNSQGVANSTVRIGSMSDIESHVTIREGRMYEKGQRSDGVYEAIATEQSLKISGLSINTVYEVASSFDVNGVTTTKIEIVGIFSAADTGDAYWAEGVDSTYINTVFMDQSTFLNGPVADQRFTVSDFAMRYMIDYQHLNMTSLDELNSLLLEQQRAFRKNGLTFKMPASDILVEYEARASQLRLILWLIQIPVMLMIVFYLFMVSQLNVEQEKNEIAVFRSRGASSRQIFGIYALESLILGAFTAILGPFVGLGFCTVLGASNGFMEFVNRTALPIRLSLEAFVYSLLAAVVFFITTMAPIIPATRTSIVEHKQKKARKKKRPLWEKLFLDIILIGGSIGWLYYYNYSREALIDNGFTASTGTVNPMLFTASTAFILGCALFMVRIHPLIIRLIYTVGRKCWSPAAYVSLNNIGRSSTGRERFLMVFLVLTVSLGIFFANTARALNRNAEEKVIYSLGCDSVITEEWKAQTVESVGDDGETVSHVSYIEPVFERFTELDGVKNAARVYKNSDVMISGDTLSYSYTADRNNRENWVDGFFIENVSTSAINDCTLMAVIPGEFANVVTSIDRLLPVQINNYLSGLNNTRTGAILSSSFRDSYHVKQGDNVTLSWGDNRFDAVVIAFVDYWPSINPFTSPNFAIINYNYLLIQAASEPYEVWIDLEEDTSAADFYGSIEQSEIEAASVVSRSQEIVSAKNDPMLQGLNGALTLGFISIMIMCIIGFLIYWILSIKGRTLQFGILRAMGMKFKEIIAMIVYEQLLVSAAAIAVAFVIGYYASRLFIPLFESLYDSQDMVPSLAVLPSRSDYLKIYVIIGVMLLIGFGVLARLISKINISKALKLGEE